MFISHILWLETRLVCSKYWISKLEPIYGACHTLTTKQNQTMGPIYFSFLQLSNILKDCKKAQLKSSIWVAKYESCLGLQV